MNEQAKGSQGARKKRILVALGEVDYLPGYGNGSQCEALLEVVGRYSLIDVDGFGESTLACKVIAEIESRADIKGSGGHRGPQSA